MAQSYADNASLGIIETIGIIPIVEAMDAMPKAARVDITHYEQVGGGRIAVCVRGEVAAVRVAIDAGVAAASAAGETTSLVIANPDAQLLKILTHRPE